MTITLDHTIVPSNDNEQAAAFLARIFDLKPLTKGHFAAVKVNDSLTLDFLTQDEVSWQHYAFLVSEDEFDQIFARIQAEELTYGSGPPNSTDDGRINRRRGGRGVYFLGGPDPHMWEIMTRAETDS